MGMFDKPKYLTGDEGYVTEGDIFWLHNARIDGTVTVNGNNRPQAKLQVSRERDGEKVIVFSSGAGITGQVLRMDATDRSNFPIEVRLDAIPTGKGNPAHVMTPADQEPRTASGSGGEDEF
jgi:hypothetical protein